VAASTDYRIAAVVVTYHPRLETLDELLSAVAPQTQGVIIVDNSADGAVDALAPGWAQPALTMIRNARNIGLAAAQNQGIDWALANGFSHVLLLDQDSVPAADCIAHLRSADMELRHLGRRVAVVGPRIVDRRTGRDYSFKEFTLAGTRHLGCDAGGRFIAADFVIASGSLMGADALRDIGIMDDGLFIDRIDIDWCLRAASMGYGVYGVCAARLRHEPGEQSKRVWIGRWTEAAMHSPERNYYMIRNSILLYRKAYAPLRWIVNDVLWLLGVVMVSCAMAPKRLRRLHLVAKGIWDGVRGVQGPLTEKSSSR
jgi:rhamnosyltransferase